MYRAHGQGYGALFSCTAGDCSQYLKCAELQDVIDGILPLFLEGTGLYIQLQPIYREELLGADTEKIA